MDTSDWLKKLNLHNGSQIGNFVIERFVGQGGTAAVFVGKSTAPGDGRRVALKILNPTMLYLDAERVRLDRQLRLCNHSCPYLIKPIAWFEACVPYSDGTDEMTLVDVSEYFEGKPLNPIILPERRIRPTISMIAKAARYLQDLGFCHRDIKPDNIIVSADMKHVVLLDLGVLHAYQQSEGEPPLTGPRTNHALVTLRYSSPEILSEKLGPSSPREAWLAHTMYQIGAILFESITESVIFDKKEREALVVAITQQDPFNGASATRCFDLVEVTKICLAKNASDRVLSLEALEFRRQARKPTIVLLYCGGTIGASSDPRGHSLHPRKLKQESALTAKVTERLQQDFKDLSPGAPLPALEWRFVDEGLQIFSENANQNVWNGITDAVTRIFSEDWSGKYLAGLILLHGTDTLAYTAAALQLVFPRIPCPIVITGSNQPPSDEENAESSWRTSQSDAWYNLLRSVLFLIDGGHRLPMVYAVFANTICHSINLQKTPLNRIPIRIAAAFRFFNEAFSYRNVELGRRFAYKYVEGILVNNFSPVLGTTALYSSASSGARAPWERVSLDVERVGPIARFSRAVDAMTMLPCDVREISSGEDFHLLVAYPSGTMADAVREKLEGWNAIVTQWGLSPRQAEYAAASGLPATESRLYRLIPETALPLLSLAASGSIEKVEAEVADIIARNPVVNALMGNPLNREKQRGRAEYLYQRALALHDQAIDSTLLRPDKIDELPVGSSESPSLQAGPSLISFRRHHFDAFIYGMVAAHAHAGSLAEQLAALFDIGFDTGISIGIEWSRRTPVSDKMDLNDMMRVVCLSILASGIAKARIEIVEGDGSMCLRFTAKMYSNQEGIYAEAWAFDSTSDHYFLSQIEEGIPLDVPDQEADYFSNELKNLHATNEKIHTSPVYWYVLGNVKGALCWFLSDRGAEPIRSANAVRPAVILRLLARKKNGGSDEARFVFPRYLYANALEVHYSNIEL
jgi:serine/threonine protein kinase